jgi:hypothetical protein
MIRHIKKLKARKLLTFRLISILAVLAMLPFFSIQPVAASRNIDLLERPSRYQLWYDDMGSNHEFRVDVTRIHLNDSRSYYVWPFQYPGQWDFQIRHIKIDGTWLYSDPWDIDTWTSGAPGTSIPGPAAL